MAVAARPEGLPETAAPRLSDLGEVRVQLPEQRTRQLPNHADRVRAALKDLEVEGPFGVGSAFHEELADAPPPAPLPAGMRSTTLKFRHVTLL